MKDKNIYKLLNQVEMDLDSYDEVKMSEKEKNKAKDMFDQSIGLKKNSIRKKLLAIAASLVIIIGISNNPVRAQLIASLDSFVYSMSDIFGIEHPGGSYELNESAFLENYELKIADLIIDERSLTLNYLVKDENGNEDQGLGIDSIDLYINGEKIKISGMIGGGHQLENGLYNTLATYFFDIPIELLEENKIRIDVKNIHKSYEILARDSVSFIFTGSKKDLSGNSQEVLVDKTIDSDFGPIKVEKIIINPYISQIYFSTPLSLDNDMGFVEASLENESGKKIQFSGGSSERNEDNNSYDNHLFSDEIGDLTYTELLESEEVFLQMYYFERGSGTLERINLGSAVEIDIK